jgi:hypothetical protein
MTPAETLLALTGIEVESIVTDNHGVAVQAHSQQQSAACPQRGDTSHHVHSYYRRQPVDLPIGGRPTRLRLRLKRFRCANPDCPRLTFAEPLTSILAPRSRRSLRLAAALEAVAFALGGQAGSRLALRLQMPCSGDTLLRMIRKAPAPSVEPPHVISVDDWAKQRGQVYGTLIVDLERRRTIELLEDRQAETLMAWLRQQPGVQVMARDRSAEYRKAAETILPQCQQMADRWHLLTPALAGGARENLKDMLEPLVTRHRRALAPTRPVAPAPQPSQPTFAAIPKVRDSDHLRYGAATRHERHQQREQLFREMQEGPAKGLTQAEIARQLGIAPNTFRPYLVRGGPPAEVSPRPPRPKLIDPFVKHLTQRWHAATRMLPASSGARSRHWLPRGTHPRGTLGARVARATRPNDSPAVSSCLSNANGGTRVD